MGSMRAPGIHTSLSPWSQNYKRALPCPDLKIIKKQVLEMKLRFSRQQGMHLPGKQSPQPQPPMSEASFCKSNQLKSSSDNCWFQSRQRLNFGLEGQQRRQKSWVKVFGFHYALTGNCCALVGSPHTVCTQSTQCVLWGHILVRANSSQL